MLWRPAGCRSSLVAACGALKRELGMAAMRPTHRPDPLRGLPLDALRGFEAAARNLSFTAAAVELHLTQSAVSREVKLIEERLGINLFERGGRTLKLTPHGIRLLEAVVPALDSLRAAMG